MRSAIPLSPGLGRLHRCRRHDTSLLSCLAGNDSALLQGLGLPFDQAGGLARLLALRWYLHSLSSRRVRRSMQVWRL